MSGPVLFPFPADSAATTTITIDPEPWRLYRESIARNEPETVALIGGSLDAPSRITDFYFMPPQRRGERFAHGAAHVELDHAAMNYVIDRVFKPSGKYMLGLWHSHPGGYDAPSAPDLLLCRAILGNDDSPGRRWPFFIAPITTFDADGRDRVAVWILHKGAAAFERAVFEPPPRLPVIPPSSDVPTAAPMPNGDARPDPIDPLAASALRLGALLAQPDGLVGVSRYRAGGHLHAALRIAEFGADREPQP